jgi:hypothetical protein
MSDRATVTGRLIEALPDTTLRRVRRTHPARSV